MKNLVRFAVAGAMLAGFATAQAQSLPLTPPTLPGLPQQNYRPQATDYTQFVDESN